MATENAIVPYSEPSWLQGLPSKYYTESHKKWQRDTREFIDRELNANAVDWETAEEIPLTVYDTFMKARMLIPCLPAPLPVAQLKAAGIETLLGGLKVEDFDAFHGAVFQDNMLRSGLMGPPGALNTGMAFGVPPIYKFGSEELQRRFLPDLFTGKKRICIAITEPTSGSDVAGTSTTAVKTADGKHYVVNGIKKWITNGVWSDYATMAVRTGGAGPGGLSLMIVPLKGHQGVSMRRLKVAGQISAGTSFIELDDVLVPVENLIGEEGMGMKYIMQNFNHERLSIAIGVTRQARVALSLAFGYCLEREAFGKPLMEQAVVRNRIAKAGIRLEALWAWIESTLYQLMVLPKEVSDLALGGQTAALKAEAGKVLQVCAETAVLLLGGNGYTRTGRGELAEKLYREVPGARIPGGSEDVLLDLSVRMVVKNYQAAIAKLKREGKL